MSTSDTNPNLHLNVLAHLLVLQPVGRRKGLEDILRLLLSSSSHIRLRRRMQNGPTSRGQARPVNPRPVTSERQGRGENTLPVIICRLLPILPKRERPRSTLP